MRVVGVALGGRFELPAGGDVSLSYTLTEPEKELIDRCLPVTVGIDGPAETLKALEIRRRLTADDLDRLAVAELTPIAFLATIRRFVSVELQETLDEAERAARNDGWRPTR